MFGIKREDCQSTTRGSGRNSNTTNFISIIGSGTQMKNYGWGVNELADTSTLKKPQIPRKFMESLDKKRTQQFVYQQDGFSAALDRKLGFQYSSRFNIKQMRDEVKAIMKSNTRRGIYSQYTSKQDQDILDEFEAGGYELKEDDLVPSRARPVPQIKLEDGDAGNQLKQQKSRFAENNQKSLQYNSSTKATIDNEMETSAKRGKISTL